MYTCCDDARGCSQGVKCQMESLKEEQEKTQKEFEDQMKVLQLVFCFLR